MIDSCRADQLRHEGLFASGITSWMRGEGGPDAIAAGQIVAETVLMWRLILNSKIEH